MCLIKSNLGLNHMSANGGKNSTFLLRIEIHLSYFLKIAIISHIALYFISLNHRMPLQRGCSINAELTWSQFLKSKIRDYSHFSQTEQHQISTIIFSGQMLVQWVCLGWVKGNCHSFLSPMNNIGSEMWATYPNYFIQ